MVKDISINALKKMREHIREMDDYLSNLIKIDEKLNVIKETEEDIKKAKKYLPWEYYNIRYEEQQIMIDIIYNKQERKKYYGVKCTNFKPPYDSKTKYDTIYKTYGNYDNLEEAVELFKKFVADLLYKNGFDIYKSLELFIY